MSVGDKLRRERVRIGVDLDTLARETRIARRYLEAIEDDDPSGCPGQFFYRSFVRQYASSVGLDPAEMEQEIGAPEPVLVEVPRPGPPQPDEFPLRSPDPIVSASNRLYFGGGMRIWASVLAFVAVVIACSALYATWRHREAGPAALVTNPKPEVPVAQPPAPVPTTQQQPKPSGQSPAAGAPPVETAAKPASSPNPVVSDGAPPAAPPVSLPASTATPTAAAAVSTPSPDDKVVVSVSAKEPAWIALSSDGKSVYTGMLEAAQSRTIGGKEQARMRVGNAGGVEVTLNGKPVGPIGPRGQVRIVVFTPEGFHIVNPSAEAPADGPIDSAKPRPPTL